MGGGRGCIWTYTAWRVTPSLHTRKAPVAACPYTAVPATANTHETGCAHAHTFRYLLVCPPPPPLSQRTSLRVWLQSGSSWLALCMFVLGIPEGVHCRLGCMNTQAGSLCLCTSPLQFWGWTERPECPGWCCLLWCLPLLTSWALSIIGNIVYV